MAKTVRPLTPPSSVEVPMWLAHRHRELAVGELLHIAPGPQPLPALSADPAAPPLEWIATGAGFALTPPNRLERLRTLPDLVGPNMRLLVIGLNPSPSSAETGIGFAYPGNRFWPAAMAAGLVERDRDPLHALESHGVGFTDIVKRTTKRAAELSAAEFRLGVDRLDALCRWLEPKACVMVGLMGWRSALDAKAKGGWQDRTLGGRPVYVMPSTSGLNASSSLAALTDHLTAAIGGPT